MANSSCSGCGRFTGQLVGVAGHWVSECGRSIGLVSVAVSLCW